VDERAKRRRLFAQETHTAVTTSCARGDTICPRPARCTHAAAHLQSIAYTPYACGAQRTLRHEYSWSTDSGSLWAVA